MKEDFLNRFAVKQLGAGSSQWQNSVAFASKKVSIYATKSRVHWPQDSVVVRLNSTEARANSRAVLAASGLVTSSLWNPESAASA